MSQIIYAFIFLLIGRVKSFSSPPTQHYGAIRPRSDSRYVGRISNSVRQGTSSRAFVSTGVQSTLDAVDITTTGDDIIDSIEVSPDAKGAHSKISLDIKDTKSELEQFIVNIRSLYQDLELAGGSIRREMNGVSFSYIAPPPSDDQSAEDNDKFSGFWRSQSPVTYQTDADWKSIHKQNIEERSRITGLPNPPPLMIYLPGLDGFGISATTQFDDLSATFELWRMTVDKGNTQLSFSDLLNSVVKFVDDATKSSESPREVMVVGESFGGLLACAVTMALKASNKYNITLKGMALVNPATSFDETNWEQFVPLLTSLRYLESQEEIVDDRGNFRFSDLVRQLPTPYSVSQQLHFHLFVFHLLRRWPAK